MEFSCFAFHLKRIRVQNSLKEKMRKMMFNILIKLWLKLSAVWDKEQTVNYKPWSFFYCIALKQCCPFFLLSPSPYSSPFFSPHPLFYYFFSPFFSPHSLSHYFSSPFFNPSPPLSLLLFVFLLPPPPLLLFFSSFLSPQPRPNYLLLFSWSISLFTTFLLLSSLYLPSLSHFSLALSPSPLLNISPVFHNFPLPHPPLPSLSLARTLLSFRLQFANWNISVW